LSDRPAVSVVVPFLGSEDEFERLLAALDALHVRPDDELIVADNRTTEAPQGDHGQVLVHPAGGVRSPGFARNRGAALASREWLVFIDADVEPSASLLDEYLVPAPRPQTGILAGGIVDQASAGEGDGEPRVAARHAVEREQMSHRMTLERARWSYAQTANCAIRRAAFAQVGGFDESIIAGEDADLCFRLHDAGWGLERRVGASVAHRTRDTLGASLRQLARHGSGAAWCNRRHPGSFPAPGPAAFAARLTGSAIRAAVAGARGDRERAAFAALEIAEATAFELGRLLPNRARR
jgi:mycofactocin glycosyltransferase